MFLQSVLVGTHLGKEFQGHWWQLCGEIQWSYGSRVMCQLLHFPAHSWSALIQHSWPSPFLLPLCKWPARSLSWKNLEWAQASTKVDTNTNGRQLKSLLWNPGLQAIPVPVNTGLGWIRCSPDGPFTSTVLWCSSECRAWAPTAITGSHKVCKERGFIFQWGMVPSKILQNIPKNPEITKELGYQNTTLKEWASAKPAHVCCNRLLSSTRKPTWLMF